MGAWALVLTLQPVLHCGKDLMEKESSAAGKRGAHSWSTGVGLGRGDGTQLLSVGVAWTQGVHVGQCSRQEEGLQY